MGISADAGALRIDAGAATGARPAVSVIVPVLDGEPFLAESLDSILEQTYPPAEVLVMDDASTDSTPAIAASYGERIRYVRQPVTRGIYGNANDGIALAGGDLIGVFHADDVYLPQMLEREVDWLERHPRAGAVFCCDIFVNVEGRELGRLALPNEVRGGGSLDYATVLNALLNHTNVFFRCETALVRAGAYRALGGYRDLEFKNSADLEMWLRIARHYQIGILEDHLVRYRRGHGSSSERYHRVRTEPFRFFRILDLELAADGRDVAERRALQAYEAHRAVDSVLRAVNHYILGDRSAALDVLREARLRKLGASRRVRRFRMLVLALALHALLRAPFVPAVARLFERRWHRTPTRAQTG